jgi:hypothetical protein
MELQSVNILHSIQIPHCLICLSDIDFESTNALSDRLLDSNLDFPFQFQCS